jgi:hypothetical protein
MKDAKREAKIRWLLDFVQFFAIHRFIAKIM